MLKKIRKNNIIIYIMVLSKLFKPLLWGYKQVDKSLQTDRSKAMTRKFYKEKQEAEDAKKYREMMKKKNVKKAKNVKKNKKK